MSRIAFLTRDLAFSQVVPPSRSSAGRDAAGVLLDQIEPLDGHEQLGVVVIAQLEELLRALAAADAELLEADELADAVIHVHHEIADLEVAEVGEERLGDARAALAGVALLVEDVALDVDLQRRHRPAGTRATRAPTADEHRRRVRVLGALHRHGHDVVLAQNLDHPLGAARALGDEEHGVAALARLAHVGHPVADAAVELQRRLARTCATPVPASSSPSASSSSRGARLESFGKSSQETNAASGARPTCAAAAPASA